MLKILVLGPPAILVDDKPLTIQRRQIRTLLFFLACQPEGVGRGELLAHFWPNAKESDARRQLREVLSKLRAQLPDPDILQTDHDRVWLSQQSVYTDFQEFKALIQPAQSFFGAARAKSTLPENIVEMMEQAVSLWRSPSFLSGARISNTNEFDDWMQETASSLEYLRLQSLEWLANHYSTIGELDKAIEFVHKALESDHLNEILQAQLLSLLYSAGRISEAQSYYSYLMEIYQREFDDIPPEILKYTMDEVTRTSFDDKKRQSVYGILQKNNVQFFVGREKELEMLEQSYQKGGVVIINGEMGAGKTLFVHHFCSSLVDKPRQFFITCHSQEENQPLQPIITLIRDYVTREDLDNCEQRYLSSLSILIPDIVRKTSSVQTIHDWSSKEAHFELFEAIHQLFISVSRSSKVLFIFDDIHCADIDTLEVLMYLSRKNFFEKHGFLILVSHTEIINPRMQNLLIPDRNHYSIPRIILGALAKNEINKLARYILGQEPTDEFLRNLQKATGGNPLFIVETLNSLMISSNNAALIQQSDIPLAENLFLIIREKEKSLSDPAREVLLAAAVCGMEFRYEILEHMHFCEPALLVRCLEELEEKRFIQPTSSFDSIGQYSFIHSLIRDSIISRLSQARQCQLHKQIAEAMSLRKGVMQNRQASIIARHFEAADKPISAFKYWVKAGQYARGLFSINETYSAFEKANGIRLNFGQSIPEEDLYELYSEWGDMAYNVMDLPMMNECYAAMYEAGEQNNDLLLIGAGLSGIALPAVFNLEIDRALVLLEQSIHILSETKNLYEQILARSRMGIALSMGLQNDKAIEIYLQAIDLGKGSTSQVVRQSIAAVQFQLSFVYSLMGWPEKAKEIGKQGLLNAYLLISKPTAQANVHLALAMAAYYYGSLSESQGHIKHSQKVLESLQNQRITTLLQILQARIYYFFGRLDTCWDLANIVLKIAVENGYFEIVSEAYCVRGDIFLALQNFPEAISEYKQGCEQMLGSFHGMNCFYRLGYATARNGEVEKGLHMLDQAITFSKEAGFGSIFLPAQYLRGLILQETGSVLEAEMIFNEVQHEAGNRGLSVDVFPESKQQLKFLCNTMDNIQAEQILSNLIREPEIQPGAWIESFILKIKNSPTNNKSFDKEHFLRFLQNTMNQIQSKNELIM